METLLSPIINSEYTDKRKRSVLINASGVTKMSAVALRMIMMSFIPSVAIVSIDVKKNSSLIHTEHLRHRLGLVNIAFDANLLREAYIDDLFDFSLFTAENSLRFQLKKEYIDNDAREDTVVRIEDLEWLPFEGQEAAFKGREPRFISPKAPILYLRHGEEVDITCYAIRGTQRQNARFSVVSSVRYQMEIDIDLDPSVSSEELQELIEVCPVGVFTEDIEDTRPLRCLNCRRCLEIPEMKDKLSIDADPNTFNFFIDSVGTMDPIEIFRQAVKVYNDREDVRIVEFPTSMPPF